MHKVDRCPICGSTQLDVLKKYSFSPPQLSERGGSAPSDYRCSRLNILFYTILKDRTSVTFDMVLCGRCGFIFTNPRFTNEQIEAKYRAISELDMPKLKKQTQSAGKKYQRSKRIFSLMRKCVSGDLSGLKVLDYGGAEGFNLAAFLEAGCRCSLVDCVRKEHDERINYLGGDIREIDIGLKFDIILCCHTLEHVVDPCLMTGELSEYLSDDGLLYVEVPLGCWKEWESLAEPLTHLNFFSEESACQCLKRSGLSVRHLTTKYQFVTHGRTWNINIVGSRKHYADDVGFSKTVDQMSDKRYLVLSAMDHPVSSMNRLLSRCKKMLRSRAAPKA